MFHGLERKIHKQQNVVYDSNVTTKGSKNEPRTTQLPNSTTGLVRDGYSGRCGNLFRINVFLGAIAMTAKKQNGGAREGAGRPTELPKGVKVKRYQVTIDDASEAAFRGIGGGKLSAGIREAGRRVFGVEPCKT